MTIPLTNLNPIPPQPALCQGDVVDLTALQSGITSQVGLFTWYKGDPVTDPFAVILTSTAAANQSPGDGTTYYAYFQPAVGCPNIVNITYTVNDLPQLNAVPPQTGCDGELADLTLLETDIANGLTGTFLWYLGDPAAGGTIIDPSIATPNSGDVYYAVFEDSSTGCENSTTVTFNNFPDPNLNALATQSVCGGATVDLTTLQNDIILSAGTFDWYDGDPANGGQILADPTMAMPIDGTIYFTEFTDALTGCSAMTSVEYSVGTIPALNTVTATPVCNAAALDLSAYNTDFTTETGVFDWYLGDPAAGGSLLADPTNVMPTDGEMYCVVFTNAGACTATGCFNITVQAEVTGITASYDCTIDQLLVDYTGGAGGSGMYQVAATSPNMEGETLTEGSDWTLLIEDSNGCQQATALTGTVDCLVPTFDLSQDNHLNVYPNPTNGQINIEFEMLKPKEIEVSVLNILGKELLRLNEGTHAQEYLKVIDLAQYPSGIYLISLKASGQHYIQKIIKE